MDGRWMEKWQDRKKEGRVDVLIDEWMMNG